MRNVVRFVVLALVVFSISACDKVSSPLSPSPGPGPGSDCILKGTCNQQPGTTDRASFGPLTGVWAGDPDRIGGTATLLTPSGTTPQGDSCYVITDPNRGGTVKQPVYNPRVVGRTLKVVWRDDLTGVWEDQIITNRLETDIVGKTGVNLGIGFGGIKQVITAIAVLDETGSDLTTPTHEERVFKFCVAR